ncbi:hypothetical protein J4450_06985 [Candidatus Micrarchaeota archaeon]|nr:hypothetical protein [Candidatus Micrarchaeota archaeon]
MKNIVFILVFATVLVLLFGCAQQKEEKKDSAPAPQPAPAPPPAEKPKLGEGDQAIEEDEIPKPPE